MCMHVCLCACVGEVVEEKVLQSRHLTYVCYYGYYSHFLGKNIEVQETNQMPEAKTGTDN